MTETPAINLLLVDDDDVDRIAVRRTLAATGMNVRMSEAAGADEAMAAMSGGATFDCVLMDYHLPATDGIHLLRSLRSNGVTCPVIALTSQGDEEIAVELMKAGAADYLSKHHLTPDRLGRSLRYAIAVSQAEDERRQLLAREQAARREAEAANRAKDEFLATLSHELRTPLNAVLGWVRLIAGGNLDESATRRAVGIIDRNVRLQAQLIDDLLDISRITSGKLSLELRSARLPQIIDAAVDTVRPAAAARGIALSVDASRAPQHIVCDAARVQQIIWNLLSNAVKFTPNGGRVSLRAETADRSVRIAVTDTGIGIHRDFLPHVFERFRQQDGATTRVHGGLGLGLAIVKHLAELHGGDVTADSPGEGRGSTFAVTLPLTAEAPREEVPSPAPVPARTPAAPRLEGVRVLLVDSDQDSRALAATVLEGAGAAVTATGSPAEALDVVQQVGPQVLVVEFADGEAGDLLSSIRELDSAVSDVGAAALIETGSSEARTHALLVGFNTSLPRPIDPAELLAVVAALARRPVRLASSAAE